MLSLRPSCTYQFTGDFGYYAQQYLTSDVLREKMLASQTIDTYKLYISRFCGVMEHQGVTTATITVKNINAFWILSWVTSTERFYPLRIS